MTLFDPRSELTLESARSAREPTTEDRARNLAALQARLGLSLAAPEGGRGLLATPPASAGIASSAAVKGKLATLALLTATLGFLVGLGLGQRVSTTEQAALLPAAPAALATPAPSAVALPRQQTTELDPSAAPAAVAVDRTQNSRVEPLRPAATRGDRTPLATPTGPARQTKSVPDGAFLAALRLLERAQRALESGDARFALSLLDELDARFPAQMLAEERQIARVLSWCALGEPARARSAAARLLRQRAHSIYAGRLERSCVQ